MSHGNGTRMGRLPLGRALKLSRVAVWIMGFFFSFLCKCDTDWRESKQRNRSRALFCFFLLAACMLRRYNRKGYRLFRLAEPARFVVSKCCNVEEKSIVSLCSALSLALMLFRMSTAFCHPLLRLMQICSQSSRALVGGCVALSGI